VVADRLRTAVVGTAVPTRGGPVDVAISVGVGHRRPGDDLDALFSRADKALSTSKAQGHNQVTLV
jgi:PleD family two-component response regulator